MADPTPTTPLDHPLDQPLDQPLDRLREQRIALKARHTHALAKLMQEREDLHGVHALADLVADSLRWSA